MNFAPFRPYLEDLLDRHQFLRIQGVGSGAGRVRSADQYPIEELYTRLLCHVDGMTRGDEDEFEGRSDLARAFARTRHLVIEGEPGAGKTTFLRLLAVLLARDALGIAHPIGTTWSEAELGLGGPARIPLLLRADDLARHCARGAPTRERLLDPFVAFSIPGRGALGIPEAEWKALLDGGHAFVLLDSFDEVGDEALRERLFAILADAKKHWPVVVAARPRFTDRLVALGFPRAVIQEFRDEEIRNFLGRWVRALYGLERTAPLVGEAERYHGRLLDAVMTRPPVRRLAANPVMLTCLCVIHWNEAEIPEGRSRAYAAVMRWLLAARRELRAELSLDGKPLGIDDDFALIAFQKLALHLMNPKGEKRARLDFDTAAEVLDAHMERQAPHLAPEDRRRAVRAWLEFECLGSCIVQKLNASEFRFWHLTFQEYLAACELAEGSDHEDEPGYWWAVLEEQLESAAWRETIDLFPVCLLDRGGRRRVDLLLQRVQRSLEETLADPLVRDARLAGLFGRMLASLEICGYRPEPKLRARYDQALHASLQLFEPEGAQRVKLELRLAAAEALGRAGDPRLGWKRENFLPIDASGELLLGKYLVTVQEYQEFVDARGYEQHDWWDQEISFELIRSGWGEPEQWRRQLWNRNCPVVGVSWYEANAYCRWRRFQHGEENVRLPSSREWHGAASPDERCHPWGNEPPTIEHASFNMSRIDHVTPVGVYVAGIGPFGHLDLAGNAWEWCSDSPDKSNEAVSVEDEGPAMLVKGGCFAYSGHHLRVSVFEWFHARNRFRGLGFRVVVLGKNVQLRPPR